MPTRYIRRFAAVIGRGLLRLASHNRQPQSDLQLLALDHHQVNVRLFKEDFKALLPTRPAELHITIPLPLLTRSFHCVLCSLDQVKLNVTITNFWFDYLKDERWHQYLLQFNDQLTALAEAWKPPERGHYLRLLIPRNLTCFEDITTPSGRLPQIRPRRSIC